MAPKLAAKTVTFVGGSISGGATWQYSTTGAGGAPAAAHIEVRTLDGTNRAKTKLALPLTVPVTIPNVTDIYLFVSIPVGVSSLTSWNSETAASVIYRITGLSPIIIPR